MSNGRNSLRVGASLVGPDVQGGPDDAEYQRLGHVEEYPVEEMEEFEMLPPLPPKRRHRAWWWIKLVVIGLVLLALAGVAFHWGLPFLLDKVIIPMMVWETSKFSRPVLAVVLIVSLAMFPVFLFPSGPSMWVTGMMFGYGFGFLIIIAGTTVGQSLPYFIGRWLLHDRIQSWLEKWPKKAALLRIAAQGGWFHQFRAVTLLRVSPFPYPWFNYAITATNIKYGPYIMGSMVGMIPEAFITIYSGRLLSTLADVKNKKRVLTPVEIAYNVVGFSLALLIAVVGTLYGRRALQDLELKEAAEREAVAQQSQQMSDVVAHVRTSKVAWAANSSQSSLEGKQWHEGGYLPFSEVASP